MTEEQMYQAARLRAERKIRFYIHLAVYLGVNIILAAINLKIDPGHLWFLWPFAGWGLAVVVHGLSVLDVFNFKAARERLVEKELAKEKYRRQMQADR